jgi:argonaute-like protein implicated in RNA metabolism and viral defense
VLEVITSGAPALFRTSGVGKNRKIFNPQVGDSFRLKGLDEMVLATYGGDELGKWGQHVSVRPLRIRKRYGASSLDELAQQVILLSRIHGASLYRHPRLPITTHHADRFATLRQESNVDSLSKMSRTCPVYL